MVFTIAVVLVFNNVLASEGKSENNGNCFRFLSKSLTAAWVILWRKAHYDKTNLKFELSSISTGIFLDSSSIVLKISLKCIESSDVKFSVEDDKLLVFRLISLDKDKLIHEFELFDCSSELDVLTNIEAAF